MSDETLFPTDEEMASISSLADALEVVESAVKALSRSDCNLMSADTICLYMINQLSKDSSEISSLLADAMKSGIIQRRSKNLVGLLKYLHDPDGLALSNE